MIAARDTTQAKVMKTLLRIRGYHDASVSLTLNLGIN